MNTFSNFVKDSLISAGYAVKKISRCTSSSVWLLWMEIKSCFLLVVLEMFFVKPLQNLELKRRRIDMNLKEENEELREILRRVYNYVPIQDQIRIDSALSQQDGNEVDSPAQDEREAVVVDRDRMVESMCLTWRHDFGMDKLEGCDCCSGMTDNEREHLRGQIGKLFDHHFESALSAVTAQRSK